MSEACITPRDYAEFKANIARQDEQIKSLFLLLSEREKQVANTFTAVERATDLALEAQKNVNATQNEFRGALRDSADKNATRTEFNTLKDEVMTKATHAETDRLVERVGTIEKSLAAGGGRQSGLSAAQALTFQILPLLLAASAFAIVLFKK
jgi:hypothetical protein